MRLGTWNIGEDERNKDGHLTLNSYQNIKEEILKNGLDIVCFQEAVTSSSKLPNLSKYISENTELKYFTFFELSDSHINIGSKMGVAICSKERIEKTEKFLLPNPDLVYKKENGKILVSHDKGFLICVINDLTIITGHGLPFHVFKKDVKDYLDIFYQLDNKIINLYHENPRIILCGDMNYDDASVLFPKFYKLANECVKYPTRKDKVLDHILVSKKLKVQSIKIIDQYFDHKLCVVDIDRLAS